MAAKVSIIHVIADLTELPAFEQEITAAVDIYENMQRTGQSSRVRYADLDQTEQQKWDEFVNMFKSRFNL